MTGPTNFFLLENENWLVNRHEKTELISHLDMLTFVPRNVTRGRRAATTIPFSPTVTATFRKVPPFPHFGQKILPISAVTVRQA